MPNRFGRKKRINQASLRIIASDSDEKDKNWYLQRQKEKGSHYTYR